jgi:hypothetical protein
MATTAPINGKITQLKNAATRLTMAAGDMGLAGAAEYCAGGKGALAWAVRLGTGGGIGAFKTTALSYWVSSFLISTFQQRRQNYSSTASFLADQKSNLMPCASGNASE